MYALDVKISNFLKQTNGPSGEYQVWNDIYNGTINADLAIYGSSRAWVHFSPKILQDSLGVSTYNLGINGHNFWLQYLRHLAYTKHNAKPKVVILSVDVFTLAKRKDLYLYQQFLPYMLWNFDIKHYTASYTGFENFDYVIPLLRYKGEEKFIKKMYGLRKRKPLRKLGYKGNVRKWSAKGEKELQKNINFKSRIDPASVKLLYQFIEECKDNDIQLIFVYPPEYITGQEFVKNRSEIFEIFTATARRANIPFLDYSKDSLSYHKTYFYNASHLNKTGAELFSKKLASDIKNMIAPFIKH